MSLLPSSVIQLITCPPDLRLDRRYERCRLCKAHKLDPSMSRRGNCWDNAVAESFFSSLKKERIRKKVYRTRDLAKADIFEYVEMFYNRTRRHSHLGGVSPEAFEAASNHRL